MNNSITINGETFLFNTFRYSNDYIGYTGTNFYKETKKEPEWEFLFWKSKKTIDVPIGLFQIEVDINDSRFSAKEMYDIILKPYLVYKRKAEIERGKFISPY